MDAAAEESFRHFVIEHWHRMAKTAYLLVSDHGHAEDLVQTTMIRLHDRWERIEQPDLYGRRILVNLAGSHWRRLWRYRERPTASVPESATAVDPIGAHDQRDELIRALGSLPKRMRAILVLRYFEDLSVADTARILGCSDGTVKSQASRGLERLRTTLGPSPAVVRDGGAPA